MLLLVSYIYQNYAFTITIMDLLLFEETQISKSKCTDQKVCRNV